MTKKETKTEKQERFLELATKLRLVKEEMAELVKDIKALEALE